METKPPSLFDYQCEDVNRCIDILSKNKAMLIASEMGAGKTAVAINTAIERGDKKILVLCPSSVRSVWQKELLLWAPEMDCNLPDTNSPSDPRAGWNVVSTSVAHNDKHVIYRITDWDMVIVDEAHQGGFKGYTGMNWSSSRMGWEFFSRGGIASRSKKVVFLTGTPVPNSPVELWPMAQLMLPSDPVIRTREKFVERYCGGSIKGRFGPIETGSSNLPELREKLRHLIVRRLKKDVLAHLPDKHLKIVELPPTSDIKRVLDYETGEIATSKQTIDAIRERMEQAKACNSLKEFEAAKQKLKAAGDIAKGQLGIYRQKVSIPKATLVAGYVELLLETKAKVIVFYHHTDHGKRLVELLSKYGALRIGGDTPSGKRGEIVRSFQEGSERVMVAQLRAAGAGLTLTAASEVVLGELDWTPGVVAQAAARSHRPGQTEEVTIHLICVEGSPDVMVATALIKKLKEIRQVVDGGAGKKKRAESMWPGKGLDPRVVGLRMSGPDCSAVHAEICRILRAGKGGKVGDGVGFPLALEGRAAWLGQLRTPSAEEYGQMALLLLRLPKQHRLTEEEVARMLGETGV